MHIILIPGIGGSKIYCECGTEKKRLYPKRPHEIFFNLNPEFFNKECKSSTAPLLSWVKISIYHNFLKKLGWGNCSIFHYDWRKPCIQLGKDLEKFINEINQPCILVGHSNGGLIIRVLFEYLKFKNDNVKHSFICGTPLYGVLSIHNYFHEHELAENLFKNSLYVGRYKPLMFTKEDFKNIIKSFRETLEFLCPTPVLLSIPDNDVLNYPKIVHRQFLNRIYSNYTFVYNVHKRKRLKGYETINAKIGTDSLVIPMIDFVKNTTVFYDHNRYPHFAMLNSPDLIKLVLECLQTK